MTFKSAYLKLTLTYVLIVMAISLIFSLVIYNISSAEINKGLGRQTKKLREFSNDSKPPIFFDDLEKIRIEELNRSNNRLKINLIYFNFLILALSSFLSYFSAKRTMRPIEEMMISQNRFIADASHELKTPLTAMRSEIEVNLRDKKLDLLSSKKLLKSNLEEIEKLETLSNALLKMAKYEEELKLDFEKLDIAEVITEAYEKVESLAIKKSITINCHCEEWSDPSFYSGQASQFQLSLRGRTKRGRSNLITQRLLRFARNDNLRKSSIYVRGEKQSLIELFVILLDNAIKYSPKRSGVTVDINKKDKQAEVKIKDHGIGIKASDLPHIFDRFYRADHSRNKESADGYGLGLSIAKRIVELHSGTIYAESTSGKGSEFIVELPLEKLTIT